MRRHAGAAGRALCVALALAISLVAASTAEAASWYVNKTFDGSDVYTLAAGNDINAGNDPNLPKATIYAALRLAAAGETIYVDAGTFTETISIDTPGISIVGVDSTLTILDANDTSLATGAVGIRGNTVGGICLKNLLVRNAYTGIQWTNVETSTIDGVAVRACGLQGIQFDTSNTNVVRSCRAESNGNDGIALRGSSGNALSAVAAAGNGSRGLYLSLGSNGNAVSGLIASGNGADGVGLFLSNGNAVTQCLSTRNVLHGIFLSSSSGNVFVQNRSDSNARYQLYLTGACADDTFRKNDLRPSAAKPDSGLFSDAVGDTFDVTRNWWFTNDSAAISGRIWGAGADSIVRVPFRLGEVDTAAGADTVAPRAPDTAAVVDTQARALRIAWSAVVASEEPEAAVGLGGYKVYRAPRPDTTLWTLVATAGAAETSVLDSGLATETTYYYRVTAVDNVAGFPNEAAFPDTIVSGTTGESAPPAAFLLRTPAQGTETTAGVFSFSWDTTTDVASPQVTFVLRRSSSPTFAAYVDSFAGADTSATLTIAGSDTVYWRVIAYDAVGNTTVNTNAGGDSRFVVDTAPPVAFLLASPADTANTSVTSCTFTWNATYDSHAGVDSYLFLVSTNSAFSPLYLADTLAETATYRAAVALLGGDTYWWRVVAIDDLGNTQASIDSRVLVVETTTPTPFYRVGPVNAHETTAVTALFSWTAAADSASAPVTYTVRRSRFSDFSVVVDSAVGLPTSATVSFAAGERNDTWFWRVVATDAAGNTRAVSPDTADSWILVDLTPPAAFSLASPADSANTSAVSVFLRWNGTADATVGMNAGGYYQLQVSSTATFGAYLVDSPVGANTSRTVLASQNNWYYWRVIAYDDVGNSRASTETRAFFVENAPPSAFLLTAPAQGTETSSNRITFRWTDSADTIDTSVTYVLRRSNDAAFAAYVDSAVGAETSALLTLPSSDTYYWRVYASDDAGNTAVAGDSWLVYDSTAPNVPTLTDPTAGETKTSPVYLQWTAVTDTHSGLASYRFQIATSAAFSAPYFDSVQLTDTNCTSVALASGAHFWRVIAADQVGNTVASASDSFVVPDTAAPAIVSFTTSPDSLVTTSPTILVTGRLTDNETPTTVSVRRLGPLTVADSVLTVGADGSFQGPFVLESDGETNATLFVLTVQDLGGNADHETIGITLVNQVVTPTLSGSLAVVTAVLPLTADSMLAVRQETASAILLLLASDTTYADSVEIRIDFAAACTGASVVVRRPDTAIFSDTYLEVALPVDSLAILQRYAVEIRVYDSTGQPFGSSTTPYSIDTDAGTGIRIIFRYRNLDFAGNEASLRVHYFEPGTGRWFPVADSSGLFVRDLGLDSLNDTIGVVVRHLTIFAPVPSGVAAATDLNTVVVFPNPFIPYDGNPLTGEAFSGAVSSANTTGIHIVNLTANASITIYDIHGRQVDRIANVGTQGFAIWDVRNERGEEVSSGVYLMVIRAPTGQTVVKKAAVIR